MPLLPPLVLSPRHPSSAAGGVADADCPHIFVSGSGEPLYPDGLHSLRSICSTCLYLAFLLPEGSISATSPLERQPMATGVHSKMRLDDPGLVMLGGVPQLLVQDNDDDESALTTRKVSDVSSSQVSSHRSKSLPLPLPSALRLPPHLAARSAPTLMTRTLLGCDVHDLENDARRGELGLGTVSVDVFDASIPASEASGSDAEDPDLLSCRPAGHSLNDVDAGIGESATTGNVHAVIVHAAAHHPRRPISSLSLSSPSISSISIDEVEEGSEDTWVNEHFELVTQASPPPRTSQSFTQTSYQPTRTLRSYRHQRARNLNLTVNTSLGLRDLQNPPMSPSPLPESELEQGNVHKEGEDGVIPFAFHLEAQGDDDDFHPNPSSESLPSSPSSLFPSSPSSFGSLRSRTYSHFFSISALSIDIAIPSSADVDGHGLQLSHLAIAPWTPQSCSTETSYGEPLEYEKEQRGYRVYDREVDASQPVSPLTSGAVDEASLVRLADQDGQNGLVSETEADEEVESQNFGPSDVQHTTGPIEPSHRSSLTQRLGSFVVRRFSLRGRRATVSTSSAPSSKEVPRTRPVSFAGAVPLTSSPTAENALDVSSYALVLRVDAAERVNETQSGSSLIIASHSRTQTFTPTVADIPPSLFPPSLIAPTSPSPRASLELEGQDLDAPTHFTPSISPKPRSSKRVSFEPRLSTEATSQDFSFTPTPSSPLGWAAQSSETTDDRTTMTVHIEHASPGPVARLLQRFNSLSRSGSTSSRNRSRSGSSSTPFVLAPPVMRALPTAVDFRSADEEDEQVFVFGQPSRHGSMSGGAAVEDDVPARVGDVADEQQLASPEVKPVTPEQMRRWSA